MLKNGLDGKKKGAFDYKWIVVGVCFLVIMITLGFCNSTKSLYLDVVTKALGIERSLFSLNETFRFLTTSVVNFFYGATVAKFGAKRLMLAVTLVMQYVVTVSNRERRKITDTRTTQD